MTCSGTADNMVKLLDRDAGRQQQVNVPRLTLSGPVRTTGGLPAAQLLLQPS